MMQNAKSVQQLTIEDFARFPVWTWAEELDEQLVIPCEGTIPGGDVFLYSDFVLASGLCVQGSLSMTIPDRVVYTFSLYRAGTEWVGVLGRPDPVSNMGTVLDGLSQLLALPEDQIFPLQARSRVPAFPAEGIIDRSRQRSQFEWSPSPV